MPTTYIPTKLKQAQVIDAGPKISFDTDTFTCLIVTAGAGLPDLTDAGVQFVADVLGTNPEIAYAGYVRQTLAGVAVNNGGGSPATDVFWDFSAITFPANAADPGTGRYIVIADTTIGSGDADNPVIAICDMDTFLSCAASDLIINPQSGGLFQWV